MCFRHVAADPNCDEHFTLLCAFNVAAIQWTLSANEVSAAIFVQYVATPLNDHHRRHLAYLFIVRLLNFGPLVDKS